MNLFSKLSFGLLLLPVGMLAQEIDYSQTIPFDPNVKTGKLKNGLTYYIRKNGKPENKVDLRLVVNAGSLQENDDQLGLAHFMEHMNFNGTKHFPKNKLVDYLQSIGVKFGQHLNAYTSFDETVYFLPIPSDSPEKLENGFNILEDWAFNANLTPEEIEKERGVVLEEYRLGLGADKRMMNNYLPKMLHNSRYAERLPIGKKEILENFKYDKITSFYKDWYRPDLMSVIVVGDIDVAQMEQKIITHFSQYKNPKNEKTRTIYEVPNHKETFVSVESDKEEPNANVQLIYKDHESPKPTITIKDYKEGITKHLFSTMLNNRLQELSNSPNPPFSYGYAYHGQTWARTKEGFQSFAMSQDEKQLDALKILATESEKVKLYGFTQSELDRAKESLLSYFESFYNEREKTESSNYVWEYQQHFLNKNTFAGIEWEYKTCPKILSDIHLNDVNSLIKNYIKDDNRVVILTGPEKEGLKKPSEQEVLNSLNIDTNTLKPYNDVEVPKSLLRKAITPGSIVKTESNEKIGTKTLYLSNGAKVTYKKTDFKNDEISFEAISLGGSNLISNEEFKKIQFAFDGLSQAGFSGLKQNDIDKFMAGKIAYLYPYIADSREGLSGNTRPKDLEYLFQTTHAYFTDLNLDSEAFEGYKEKQKTYYKNMEANPNNYFYIDLYNYLNKENPRFNGLIPTEKTWAEMDYNLAHKKFKERFANAADFEFYFVGNIDDKKIEEFSAKYIASLPATNNKEKSVDLGYRFLKGDLKKIVHKGTDPKSSVLISYYGDTTYNAKEALALDALGEILTIKLIEQLRENESGVYGISANGEMRKTPYGAYDFNISFPCGPENAEKLTASALNELQKIITNGPEAKDLSKYKEAELLELKEKRKENHFWISYLTKSFINGNPAEDVLKIEEKINALTAKEIQDVAKKYLTKDKAIGILMPEKKQS